MKPEPMERELFLNGTINLERIQPIIKAIIDINKDDEAKSQEYVSWERQPIKLFITSQGGEVYNGLSLVDIIQASKTPIYTVCLGEAMSMGLWIFMAEAKRYIGKNATLMFHDISTNIEGKTEFLQQEADECKRLREIYKDIIINNSNVSEKQLNQYIDRKSEWYISAKEAIKLKLADDYLTF